MFERCYVCGRFILSGVVKNKKLVHVECQRIIEVQETNERLIKMLVRSDVALDKLGRSLSTLKAQVAQQDSAINYLTNRMLEDNKTICDLIAFLRVRTQWDLTAFTGQDVSSEVHVIHKEETECSEKDK
jgi:hypothetical protein